MTLIVVVTCDGSNLTFTGFNKGNINYSKKEFWLLFQPIRPLLKSNRTYLAQTQIMAGEECISIAKNSQHWQGKDSNLGGYLL